MPVPHKLAYIDAMRGWAILAVVAVHCAQVIAPSSAGLRRLLASCTCGVQLFYVASSLTLCMSWYARQSVEAHPIRNFYIRRFFRIAPLFYLAIALYVGLAGEAPRFQAPNGIEWWFIALTALFLHGLHPETINSVVPGGWSIAVEMTFYLVLPLLIRQFRTLPRLVVLLVGSLVLYAINNRYLPMLFDYPTKQQYLLGLFTFYNFFGQFPVFVMGMMLYRVMLLEPSDRTVWWVCWVALPLLSLAMALPTQYIPHHLIAGLGFTCMALALSRFRASWIVNSWTVKLGKLSFGVYLVHFAVIRAYSASGIGTAFTGTDLNFALCFGLVLGGAAFAAQALHTSIEIPGIALGSRWIRRLERSEEKQPATVAP